MKKKLLKFIVGFVSCVMCHVSNSYAKEITIIYTGQTHAMVYTCSCPKERDGGISRRGSLIKQIKKAVPDALILDSGNFISGGQFDEYAQTPELDMQRARINLKALEMMKYDCLAVSPDEFNFGKDFLQENAKNTNLSLLSSNVKMEGILPFIILERQGVKIGIIAVTAPSLPQKSGQVKVIEPQAGIREQISEVKQKGAEIIILLSNLGEAENTAIIKESKDIDILIASYAPGKEEARKIDNTIVLIPSWQGRKLGKATFSLKDGKVANYKAEMIRLSDKITDDTEIMSILPRCFSDKNCKKEGFIGSCENPGSIESKCLFSEANKVNLLVISSRDCTTCHTENLVNFLKKQYPGLSVSYFYLPDKKADRLIKDFAIQALPAYLLGKEIEKENSFNNIKGNLELKGDYYFIKTQMAGFAYLLNRKPTPGSLDIFLSLSDKDAPKILETVKEFNPVIHFLAVEHQGGFDAIGGKPEAEEYLRSVCVQKYYPNEFWDYISCRAKNMTSSWWEDCALNLDADKIKGCAKSEEASSLLKENISLNRELEVMFGPTYLVANKEIFGSKGVLQKEELKKIIQR
ncbi:MAG: hypothetical protein AB1481_01395 [Candidatus Omnitrophota bacterium]